MENSKKRERLFLEQMEKNENEYLKEENREMREKNEKLLKNKRKKKIVKKKKEKKIIKEIQKEKKQINAEKRKKREQEAEKALLKKRLMNDEKIEKQRLMLIEEDERKIKREKLKIEAKKIREEKIREENEEKNRLFLEKIKEKRSLNNRKLIALATFPLNDCELCNKIGMRNHNYRHHINTVPHKILQKIEEGKYEYIKFNDNLVFCECCNKFIGIKLQIINHIYSRKHQSNIKNLKNLITNILKSKLYDNDIHLIKYITSYL